MQQCLALWHEWFGHMEHYQLDGVAKKMIDRRLVVALVVQWAKSLIELES